MKTKIKSLAKIGILVLGFSFFLLMNCEKEDYSDFETINTKPLFTSKQINKEQIFNNSKLKNRLETFQQENPKKLNSKEMQKNNHKIYSSQEYGFSIDTNRAMYLESQDGNYHSYTFLVERDGENQNGIENLLLSLQEDGSYQAILIKYNFEFNTAQDFNQELSDTNVSIAALDSENLISELTAKTTVGGMCFYTTETSCAVDNPDHPGGYENGHECPAHQATYGVTCFGFGTGGTTGTGYETYPDNYETNGGSGSNNGNTTNNTQNITTPVIPPTMAEQLSTFTGITLTNQQEVWANKPNNEENVRDIMDFILLNCYENSTTCQQAQQFAIKALNVIMDTSNDINSFEDSYVHESPDNEIIDMEEFLSCLDTTQPANLTLYVNQPITNSSIPMSASGDVGHAFLSISQGYNTVVYGFYPKQKAKAFIVSDGAIGNNQGDIYDVSITTSISASQLNNIVSYSETIPAHYNINLFNCTDYVITIGNAAELNLPDCFAIYPGVGNGGSSPSVLGQYLRNLPSNSNYTISTTTTNAPMQSGNCN